MELWDLYNKKREKLNLIHQRGSDLPNDHYHLVVHVYLINQQQQLLITKRHPNKLAPLKWEVTMGSVVSGDDTLKTAIKEVKEEVGLVLKDTDLKLINTIIHQHSIIDVYTVKLDFCLSEVTLQTGETLAAKLVSQQELLSLIEMDQFANWHQLSDFEVIFNE